MKFIANVTNFIGTLFKIYSNITKFISTPSGIESEKKSLIKII